MNQNELIRKLNSVGKQAFVENYDLFQRFSCGQISRENAIEELVRNGVSNQAGAAIRVGNACQIFIAQKQFEALRIIGRSSRMPYSVSALVKDLLATHA